MHFRVYASHCQLKPCLLFVAGFQGKDCAVDIDLCSLGLCQEHALKCIETEDGNNVTCICEKGEFCNFRGDLNTF